LSARLTTSWFRYDGAILKLTIHAQPGAARTEIAGVYGDALKIRIASRAIANKANDELLGFLADVFAVPLRQVSLVQGARTRRKIVQVLGASRAPETLAKIA
jgi:uncharacterized protein (TIGR00251 family)